MDALSLCEEDEDDLPKWLQEEPDEELRLFRFVLPSTFPISALSYPLAGASPAPSLEDSVSSLPSLEFRVVAVGRHLQHIRGAIGRQVWPAAEVLVEYLFVNHALIAQKRILELGAGAGLSSLAISALAQHVTATEGDASLLPLLQRNLSLRPSISVSLLKWTVEVAEGSEKFDLVIASDCIYAAPAVKPFFSTAFRALHPGGRLILANHVGRVGPVQALFDEAWREANFEMREEPLSAFNSVATQPIRLFVFTRKLS